MEMQQHGGGIGGYFGLEVTPHHNFPQSGGLLLNAGRHALAYLLQHAPVPPTKVYIPFYTCASVRRAVERLRLPYEQYHLDARMLPADIPTLKAGEYLVQTNYFGLMDTALQTAAAHYGNALIADMAQALYAPATALSFYSPAKWCGISDGGVACCSMREGYDALPQDSSWETAAQLLIRPDAGSAAGYAAYKAAHKGVDAKGIRRMSALTRHLISGIDFEAARRRRRNNFRLLHEALGGMNPYPVPESGFACPMLYPLLVKNGAAARKALIESKIFVATYWPAVLEACPPGSTEHTLSSNLIPLPIDQRYGEEEMEYIITQVQKLL